MSELITPIIVARYRYLSEVNWRIAFKLKPEDTSLYIGVRYLDGFGDLSNSKYYFEYGGIHYRSFYGLTETEFISELSQSLFHEWDDDCYDLVKDADETVHNLNNKDVLLGVLTEMQDKELEKRKTLEKTQLLGKAEQFGCSPQLAKYIQSLEWRIKELEDKYGC